jgi:hypothetical protein
MNIFKRFFYEVTGTEEPINETPTPTPTPEPEEEWIWVEGYKGTDKDMKCRDYQYELGVQYDMADDENIEVCKNGFHLCLKLCDVYSYYDIGDGNRFFKVRALVRKSDMDKYSSQHYVSWDHRMYYTGMGNNKLTSKSIIFLSELTPNEIISGVIIHDLPSQYYQMAIDHSIKYAFDTYHKDALIEDGYSEAFTHHIISVNKFDIAHAVASQKDLSMDVKVLYILHNS